MDLKEQYFDWMINRIFYDKSLIKLYCGLLAYLNSIVFLWQIDMDENRQKDAQDLRYMFGDDYGYSEGQICRELDIEPPTLLEVIVALIIRAQENILAGTDDICINQEIFIDIITNLKLENLVGGFLSNNEIDYANTCINNLFNHAYSYYGEGGLFKVDNPKQDMRNTEIWYQFMWYLDEKLGGKYL